MKISRELKIGVFGVVTLTLFIISVNFIKGKDLFHKHRTFYAMYNSTSGIQDAAPVLVNGLEVGKVTGMRFADKHSGKILIDLTIYSDVFVPSNSVANIFSLDLLGTKNIEIKLGDSKIEAQDGDTLLGGSQMSLSEEVNMQVAPLKLKAENLLSSLDTMVTVLQSVFNSETRKNINASFISIRSTLSNLENTTYNVDTLVYGQRKRLERIMFNIESITDNFRKNDENISNILSNFSLISDTLAKSNLAGTLANVNIVLNQVATITTKIDKGEGSLGMLVNDQKLYENLNKSASQLNLLIEDMKLNPYRYVNFSVFPPSKKRMGYSEPVK
ncbi:MAG: MlaD family protein [Lentimicrobiaceae bacterium]|jgi:phospholipid/cholesterol/gamma-HCH transport system substrate-binding protein